MIVLHASGQPNARHAAGGILHTKTYVTAETRKLN